MLPWVGNEKKIEEAEDGDPAAAIRLRIVHSIDSLAPEMGGPSYTVPALARAVAECGPLVVVRTAELGGSIQRGEPLVEGIQYTRTGGYFGRRLGCSRELKNALKEDVRKGSVLHSHGLWLMPSIYPGLVQVGGRSSVVISPRGMLAKEALRISKYRKMAFWHVCQRRALEAADCIHVTAHSEYCEVRELGLRTPVAIIPNGVEVPSASDLSYWRAQKLDGNGFDGPYVLSLGRIHPKKGLDRLIAAWVRVEQRCPRWHLRIVGPDQENHAADLRRLIACLGAQRISIEEPLYGVQKSALLAMAGLSVLATKNENFGMVVAESLAHGVPVVSTKGAPWGGLITERCGWWVDHSPEALAAAISSALELPTSSRRQMGVRGRAWMGRDFGWSRIGRDMVDVYHWLEKGGAPPASVCLA